MKKYTLANLIQSLQYLQHDLPVVLSQSEYPVHFCHKHDKIHLEIKNADISPMMTVGQLRDLARDFATTRIKDEGCFLRRSVNIIRVENGRTVNFAVKSLELVIGQNDQGYVYLVLDEA